MFIDNCIETVEAMLNSGSQWKAIADAVDLQGNTAGDNLKRMYWRYCKRNNKEPIRRALKVTREQLEFCRDSGFTKAKAAYYLKADAGSILAAINKYGIELPSGKDTRGGKAIVQENDVIEMFQSHGKEGVIFLFEQCGLTRSAAYVRIYALARAGKINYDIDDRKVRPSDTCMYQEQFSLVADLPQEVRHMAHMKWKQTITPFQPWFGR